MNNADMPAMPLTTDQIDYSQRGFGYDGLTKREHFAGLAMNRIVAADKNGVMGPEITALSAVRMADALLAALEQEQAK